MPQIRFHMDCVEIGFGALADISARRAVILFFKEIFDVDHF